MNPDQIVEAIEAGGGWLVLRGDRIRYSLPHESGPLLEELRQKRDDVVRLLRQRASPPGMPIGVELVRWNPKKAPVLLSRWSVVTDVPSFASATLDQIRAALSGKSWLAGSWSVRELVDRLQQVGIEVEVKLQPMSSEERKR